jgi:enoyl-CoA hydratase/carnithine racemase
MRCAQAWRRLKEWPELVLERIEDAGVARIILNRPDKRNCLNVPLVTALFEALDIVKSDRELKVLITRRRPGLQLRSRPPTFCVR